MMKRVEISSTVRLIVVAVLTLSSIAHAEIDSLPGFSASGKDGALLDQLTWTPSPTVADINNDGDLEVIAATGNGYLFVYNNQGQLLWSQGVPSASCREAVSNNRLHSSPAVADLNNDGIKEIVIGYGSIARIICGGGVVVYDGLTGAKIVEHKSIDLLRKFKNPNTFLYGVYSTPAISDIDGDGLKEFAFGSFDRTIYILGYNKKGKIAPRFGLQAADTVWSSAAMYDVNNDGIEEIYIGSDISRNQYLRPPTKNGGYMNAIKIDPDSKQKRFVFRESDALLWQNYSDQVVFSSPVIADVLPDAGEEVVFLTGCYFKNPQGEYKGNYIKILNAATGSKLREINIDRCSQSQPAIGDVDGDGLLDVIVTVNGENSGKVEAYNPITGNLKWSKSVSYKDVGYASPVVADLDNNGSPEVAYTYGNGVEIVDGVNGELLYRFVSGGTTVSTPAVADLDKDGKLELIFVGAKRLFALTGFEGSLGSSPSGQTPSKIYTGMFRYNAARTGVYDAD